MILGASGFLGGELYRELHPFYDVYGTYHTPHEKFDKNQRFIEWDLEIDPIQFILQDLKPDLIISCLKGNFAGQVRVHEEISEFLLTHESKIIYISSANVFDAFTNFPSYEYDKTLSESIYGRSKIKIENNLMRLPNALFTIVRLPMVFGYNSPKVKEIKLLHDLDAPLEVFPNVVINATTHQKFTQQLHYIINRDLEGTYHLGSTDLIHHKELIEEICEALQLEVPLFKNVYSSNRDRYIAVLPKFHNLPEHLTISIEDVIYNSVKIWNVMGKMKKEEVQTKLESLKGWKHEGDSIEKEFEFDDFKTAFAFMTRVAFEAEALTHHPNWENVYNSVKISLNTHDAHGITQKDFDLAEKIEAI